MYVLELPVVSRHTPVLVAMGAIRSSGRSGICVVDDTGRIGLVRVTEVARARDAGAATIAGVAGVTVVEVGAGHVDSYGLNTAEPRLTAQGYERLADSLDTAYLTTTILQLTSPMAEGILGTISVITRRETFATELCAPSDYYCTVNSSHAFGAGQVVEGQACPRGDGGVIARV